MPALRLLLALLLGGPFLASGQPANLGDQRLAVIDDPLRVEFRSPPAELSLDRMRQAIPIVAGAKGWRVLGERAGAVELTRTVNGRHVMKVEIAYDPAGYDIRYLDSRELMYRELGGVRAIHRNYNGWIRELASAINSGLAVGVTSTTVGSGPRVAASPRPATTAAQAPPGERVGPRLPRAGDYWKYSFRDERYRRRVEYFTIEVADVRGWKVIDVLGREHGDPSQRLKRSIDANEFALVGRRLHEDYFTFELAPYLADAARIDSLAAGDVPRHFPNGWKVRVTRIAQERVEVPAGSFDAVRVEVTADAQLPGAGARRRLYTLWYAAEAKRYVKLQHQAWGLGGSLTADEIVRLEEYRLQ